MVCLGTATDVFETRGLAGCGYERVSAVLVFFVRDLGIEGSRSRAFGTGVVLGSFGWDGFFFPFCRL